MTELINAYITREHFENIERICRRLEENGIEPFVINSGRDMEIAVKRHEKERADIIVFDYLEAWENNKKHQQ